MDFCIVILAGFGVVRLAALRFKFSKIVSAAGSYLCLSYDARLRACAHTQTRVIFRLNFYFFFNSAYKITVTITTHIHTHVLCVTIDMLVIDSYRTSKRTPDELENKDEHNKYECQHNSYNSVIFLWLISEDLQQISIYDIIFVMN